MANEVVGNRTGLSGLAWVALVLTIIGAINWGLIGLTPKLARRLPDPEDQQ